MSDSDARVLAKLEAIASAQHEGTLAQGRLLHEVSGVRSDVARLAERVLAVEERAERAERLASEAKRAADGAVTETGQVYKAWQVNAEALRQTVQRVSEEVAEVRSDTKGQNEQLAALVKASETAELHQQWQREQAEKSERDAAKLEAARDALMKRVKFWAWLIGAVITALVALGGAVTWVRAHWREAPSAEH
jgi:hypothetical protein